MFSFSKAKHHHQPVYKSVFRLRSSSSKTEDVWYGYYVSRLVPRSRCIFRTKSHELSAFVSTSASACAIASANANASEAKRPSLWGYRIGTVAVTSASYF